MNDVWEATIREWKLKKKRKTKESCMREEKKRRKVSRMCRIEVFFVLCF